MDMIEDMERKFVLMELGFAKIQKENSNLNEQFGRCEKTNAVLRDEVNEVKNGLKELQLSVEQVNRIPQIQLIYYLFEWHFLDTKRART